MAQALDGRAWRWSLRWTEWVGVVCPPAFPPQFGATRRVMNRSWQPSSAPTLPRTPPPMPLCPCRGTPSDGHGFRSELIYQPCDRGHLGSAHLHRPPPSMGNLRACSSHISLPDHPCSQPGSPASRAGHVRVGEARHDIPPPDSLRSASHERTGGVQRSIQRASRARRRDLPR